MSRALPQPIATKLSSLRRGVRLWLCMVGVSRLVVLTVALVFVSLLVDRYFRMDVSQRLLSLVLGLGILAWTAWRELARGLQRPLGDDELSWDLELRHPELGQSLISAVQLSAAGSAGCSAALVEAAIGEGARRVQSVNVADVLHGGRRNRHLGLAALAIGVVVAVSMAFPGTMSLWFQRNVLMSSAQWPQDTHLQINNLRDGSLYVPRGDDLEVWVKASGRVPSLVTVDYRGKAVGSASEEMVRVGDLGFRWSFRNILEPMRLRVRGGDAVSDWVEVKLVDRPAIKQMGFSVAAPAYTKLARQDLPLGEGSYSILRGSVLTLNATANKPLAKVEVWRGKEPAGAASVSGSSFRLELKGSDIATAAYQIQLTDTEGLGSRPPARFTLKLIEDARPTVRAKLEGISEMITARASVPVQFKVNDDFAIMEVKLAVQDPGSLSATTSPTTDQVARSYRRIDLPEVKAALGGKELSGGHRLEVEPLKLSTDSHLIFYVEAKDNDTLSGPKTGVSPTFSLKVVSEEVLRNELLRREQEQRGEFERVYEQQKSLLAESNAVRNGATTQPVWSDDNQRRVKDTEKRQRLLGQRCETIALQFAQILAEVENNKLEEVEGPVRKRLQDGIVTPLRSLAATSIPQAADYLDQAASGTAQKPAKLEALARAAATQEQILARMRDIMKNMTKWEGYQEAVLLIREILKDQKDVTEATIKAEKERIKRIFGDDK